MREASRFTAAYRRARTIVFVLVCLVAFQTTEVLHRTSPVQAQVENEATDAALLVENPAVSIIGYSENFDGVAAPQLPANWTTAATGVGTLFVNQTTSPDTPPNAVFTSNPGNIGSAEIVSPPVRVGGNSPKLIFRHLYNTESTFDGGVLEIKIGSGAFQDVVAAGGAFALGGYNATISSSFGNPLAGRRAWSGRSGGTTATYITTEVNLPASAYRQIVQFKWRFGTDNSISAVGWRIDTVQVTNAISGENPNMISIPAGGTASPYPSEINITNHDGLVTSVQVNLQNFTHNSPDDVDLVLVSPDGRKAVLMSDVGGSSPVNNLALSFDDAAASLLPDSAPLVSGVYKPTNFEPNDEFPAPAPPGAPTGNMLSVFNGGVANGVWKLFLVDDNGENAGQISGGWSLAIQSAPNVIAIPSNGTASPYPDEINITGLPGSITRATVTLSNFSHTSPDDVDILLVAPSGRRLVLMSDVGGGTEVGGLNLTFDDAAPNSLPDAAPITSGSYRPTDFEPGDDFPAPAPTGSPTGSTLNAFYGSAPNGVWKLYVVDDTGENIGSIAGSWSVNLQTSTSACLFTLSPSVQAFPITGGSGSFTITMPVGCSWTASTGNSFLSITSGSGGEGNGVLSFAVEPNMSGGRSGTIDVTNGVTTRSFLVQQPSGCPFSMSQTTFGVGPAGGAGSVSVTAGSGCLWQASTDVPWMTITSGQQTGSGAVTFSVQPNPTANRRTANVAIGLLSLTVTQAGAGVGKYDFDGDGKTDISVFRPSTGVWWLLNSGQPGSFASVQFGLSTDRITPADFDGDRRTDFAVYRDGVWYVLQSQSGSVRVENWGLAGDMTVPADYDGDSRADLAVYRPGEGVWYVRRSTDGGFQAIGFGLSTDFPVPADYDGDSRADLAVYRAGAALGEQSFWAILQSSNNTASIRPFGTGGDIPVPGDYDGDGLETMAVFRPSNGTWYTSPEISRNYDARQWGTSGDIPAPGDYNGDGRTDLAVVRQNVWYVLFSGGDETRYEYWGAAGDKPVPAAYLP